MSDSGDIDTALVNRLSGDATLIGLLPDGVWFDEAAQGRTKFVMCNVVFAIDSTQMGEATKRRATEDIIYEVKAIVMGSSGSVAKQAAARIDYLLEDKPLTVPGYHCLSIARIERLRNVEVDTVDPTIRWQHRGGQYRVVVTPVEVAP